jgi:hypothetical protein
MRVPGVIHIFRLHWDQRLQGSSRQLGFSPGVKLTAVPHPPQLLLWLTSTHFQVETLILKVSGKV